jgi:hypothetical protein
MYTSDGTSSIPPGSNRHLCTHSNTHLLSAAPSASKALTIVATIFIAVFITLLIVNHPAGPAMAFLSKPSTDYCSRGSQFSRTFPPMSLAILSNPK